MKQSLVRSRRRRSLLIELLEERLVLSNIVVPLDPTLDQFGDQIITIQAFEDASRATFGIFDTGSSAVTFASTDQEDFDATVGAIPIKVPGGALAEGIGGSITGDVSQPGRIIAAGLNAASLTFDEFGFPIFDINFGAGSASTPGIQTFVGTADGSPILPAIVGTPLLVPNSENPSGYAAYVDMLGVQLDFSDLIPDLILAMPNVNFVSPDTPITPAAGTTAPAKIALQVYGADNYAHPGNLITESYNYVQPDTSVVMGDKHVDHQPFLFDTGAQLTVVSTQVAEQLGLDLDHPETTITVEGVAGETDVPGFTIDSLVVPTADGTITFTNVPIYVLDVAPDIQGILGMNLFNTGDKILFDPYSASGPSVSVDFFTDPNRGVGGDDGDINAILNSLGRGFAGSFHGQQLPGFQFMGSDVSGQVYQDINGNGSRDTGEPAMAGVTVFLDADNNGAINNGELTATTDANGAYAFQNPANGSYTLREVLPSGMIIDPAAPQSFPVLISGNTQLANLNFRNIVAPTSKISGLAYQDLNGDGVKNAGEPVLVGATIFLDANNNHQPDAGEAKAVTDAHGAFVFTTPANGSYMVREVVPGGLLLDPGSAPSYSVVISSNTQLANLEFRNVPLSPDSQTAYIRLLYGDLFDRAADPGGLTAWKAALQAGVTRAGVARLFWESPEHRSLQVDAYYQEFLHRQADPGGKQLWLTSFQHGANEIDVEHGFVTSPEYLKAHPTNLSLVQGLYADVLVRAADPGGLAFWQSALQTGVQSQVLLSFLTSSEAYSHRIDGFYMSFLRRQKDPQGLQAWLHALTDQHASVEDVAVSFVSSDEFFALAAARVGS